MNSYSRIPPAWRGALDLVTEQRRQTATQVVLDALAPALLPVLQGNARLVDQPSSPNSRLGQPARLPRLEVEQRSDDK